MIKKVYVKWRKRGNENGQQLGCIAYFINSLGNRVNRHLRSKSFC